MGYIMQVLLMKQLFTTMRTISEHMRLEHGYLYNEWTDFLSAKNKDESKKLLKKFNDRLLAHMKLEDGDMSPTFNKALGIEKGVGLATLISRDHEQIVKLLNRVQEALDTDDSKKTTEAENHFIRALMKHHKKEEELLYDLFDIMISKKDWEAILEGKL